MTTVVEEVPALAAGDNLTRKDFLRIWEMHPEIKRAELLGGVVFMPSPVSTGHGDMEGDVGTWMGYYKAYTPGCASGHNATSFILEDAPQPDINLRILPEYGGGAYLEGEYLAGVPEMLTEICRSSVVYDLHQKKDLYEAAGVPEYLAILIAEKEIRWHCLEAGKYRLLQPDGDGIYRSRIFPGLWLDDTALFEGDLQKVLATLQEGLASEGHQIFLKRLADRLQG